MTPRRRKKGEEEEEEQWLTMPTGICLKEKEIKNQNEEGSYNQSQKQLCLDHPDSMRNMEI